jgi:hypothetical protein
MPACPACRDTGFVCENHPDKLWGPECCHEAAFNDTCEHGACGCGAGDPCPACCPSGPFTSIADAFTPRFREVR